MKALAYLGPNRLAWQDSPDPVITSPTDAVVRVDLTTICGSDLHIAKGDLPEVEVGRILGHEAVGTVMTIGANVHTLTPGDRVVVSCITSCGTCAPCRTARYGQCRGGGGWILGHTIDGTQAESVRVPFADTSTTPLPAGVTDEAALMLSDVLPTGYEVGVLNGHVVPGNVVVVIGAGPVGLAVITGATLFTPSHIVAVDLVPSRLALAHRFGATDTVQSGEQDPLEVIHALTDGQGADVVVEAVGTPQTFELAITLVRPGGHVANVGVHGRPATLHLETLWTLDVTITTGLVDTSSLPTLSRLLGTHQLDGEKFVTHHFPLDQVLEAYDIFSRAGDTGALKVALTPTTTETS